MNKRIRKIFVFSLVFCMVLTQMLMTNTAFASVTGNKITGMDKYETAVKVSQAGWTSSSYVVLAYGEDFPDALCSVPLAKKYNAPILLTPKSSLPSTVTSEIQRLGASNVMIVGGEGVISKSIEDSLKSSGKTVTRFAGADRYETSLAVARHIGGTSEVVLAYGENYPDALSISSIAASKGMPILLTGTTSMPSSVRSFIGSKKVYVVGGTGVINNAQLSGINYERLSGLDRYETNVAVLQRFQDLNFSKVYLATGLDYTYALIASPLAAKSYSPVALVDADIPTATKNLLISKMGGSGQITAVGYVPDSAITSIGGSIGSGTVPQAQDIKITSITPLTKDARVVRVAFNKPVSSLTSSDISVVNKETQEMVGVYDVLTATNGMSANIEFMPDSYEDEYLEGGETYTFTIAVNGSTIVYDYGVTASSAGRVVDYDKDDSEIEVMDEDEDTTSYYLSDDSDVDYAEMIGRKVNLKTDGDDEVTSYTLESEKVKYDAVELYTEDESVTLISDDDEYDLSDDCIYRVNGEIEDDEEDLDGEKYDYAKIVLDKKGDVVFLDLYDWDDFMAVADVDDDTIYGYDDDEIDAEDYLFIKDGKTIDYDDIDEGDMLFYSEDAEVAEVYNKTVKEELEDVYEDEFSIDGDEYTYDIDNDYDTDEIQYTDGDDVDVFDYDTAYDLEGDKVTLYLDRAGNGIFVDTNGKSGSKDDDDDDTEDYIALIDEEPDKLSGEDTWEMHIWIEGDLEEYYTEEDEGVLDDIDLEAGDIVEVTIDEDTDEITEVTVPRSSRLIEEEEVDSIDTSDDVIEVDGEEYELDSDAVIYDVTDMDDIQEIDLSDIDEGDEVTLLLESSSSNNVLCLLLTDN